MRKVLSIILVCIIAIGLTSCDNRPKIVGEWHGSFSEGSIGVEEPLMATLYFGKDGKAKATYMLSLIQSLELTDSVTATYDVSVSAITTIDGMWQYVQDEDDEVEINFDPATLHVDLDEESINIRAAEAGAEVTPAIDAMKADLAARYIDQVTTMMRGISAKFILDDVKVEPPFLTFELNHIDYSFRKVE